MSQQIINISTPDDGLGDVLRNGFDKTNQNFTELYSGKVDKITGKGLSENDFTDADKSKLDGIEAVAEVNVQSDWGETDPLVDSFILNKPPSLYSAFGYFHYSDLATQTTPLAFVASPPLQLINDTLGAFTNEDQAPYGISSVWNTSTNALDFSQLSVGDGVLIRTDLSISTTSVNQNLRLYIKFGIGTPSEYDLLIDSWNEKSVVTFDEFIKDVSFSIDNEDWRDAPAKIYLLSDDDGSVKVNGWYIPIIRKSVNIVDIPSDASKQDKLTETNFGDFIENEISLKSSPSPFDTILGRDTDNEIGVKFCYPIVEGYFNGTNFYLESGFVNLIQSTTGRTYIDLSTNSQYRWSGSAYVQIGGAKRVAICDLGRFLIKVPYINTFVVGGAASLYYNPNTSTGITNHLLLIPGNASIIYKVPFDCSLIELSISVSTLSDSNISIWKTAPNQQALNPIELFYVEDSSGNVGIVNFEINSGTILKDSYIHIFYARRLYTSNWFSVAFLRFKEI